ncbi:MAG: hypothetical protein RIB84_17755 [Sneathiellaceae bacterium]
MKAERLKVAPARRSRRRSGGRGGRVLIYSHDSFGLGHLRRCRAIAHDLVSRHKDLSVLILSGSPIIGSFDFRSRVDFVRVPGVIKLRNGKYTSLSLHIDIQETLRIRSSIIHHTALAFDPDVFIVDKEPLGLRGEVLPTLEHLKSAGCRLVLGLRDVMDEPRLLIPEWRRKNVRPALEELYDDIWIYGLRDICDPLAGMALSKAIRKKIHFTGYLRRASPADVSPPADVPEEIGENYILVTPGGGGDGQALVDWVLSAYEHDDGIPYPAIIVLGPFMPPEARAEFHERAHALDNVHVMTFSAQMESLVVGAVGLVAMGGNNTFCEILSLDKRALILPRIAPRQEQLIRAARAAELGLVGMLAPEPPYDPRVMAAALRELPDRPLPSHVVIPGLLDGLDGVNDRLQAWLSSSPAMEEQARTATGPA